MAASEFDIVIRGATLVQPGQAPFAGSIGIKDGKIAAVTDAVVSLNGANDVVEARGLHVFPGVIEPHAHWTLGDGLNDFYTESRSSALGGVTCTLLFLREPEPYDALFQRYCEAGTAQSVIDFSFHAVLMIEAHLDEIGHYVKDLGITSFKFYLTYRGEDARLMGIETLDDGFLWDAFQRVARYPEALVIAHCENIELVNRIRTRLKAQGQDDMEAWQASRPVLAEVEGVRRALLFAEAAGCRLNVLHLTSARGLEEIRAFRHRYPPIYAEVCHAYLTWHAENSLPRAAKMKPALRTRADNEALWQGIADGSINTIGSDHVPRKLEKKLGSVWNPATGCPGTATLFPIVLSEGYHKRGIPLQRIAEATALNPARLYGLYPRKGHLGVGADADLTVVDLAHERVVTAADLQSYADYTLYEGWRVQGWPRHTLVRGQWVVRDGEVVGQPGTGEYVPRR